MVNMELFHSLKRVIYLSKLDFPTFERRPPSRNKRITIDTNQSNIIKQFSLNITDIREKETVYNHFKSNGDDTHADDILRFQIMFLSSTLDFYMHEITKDSILKMYSKEKEKSKFYETIMISLESVEILRDTPDSVEWLEEEMIHRESFKSYQSTNNIRKCLAMNSKKTIWKIASDYFEGKGISIKDHLTELYEKRNRIAHQSDREPITRIKYAIEHNFVKEKIDIIEEFVNIIHNELKSDN